MIDVVYSCTGYRKCKGDRNLWRFTGEPIVFVQERAGRSGCLDALEEKIFLGRQHGRGNPSPRYSVFQTIGARPLARLFRADQIPGDGRYKLPVCLAMAQSWDLDKIKTGHDGYFRRVPRLFQHNGDELHYWCPTINSCPGSAQRPSDENFGEDPYLSGSLPQATYRACRETLMKLQKICCDSKTLYDEQQRKQPLTVLRMRMKPLSVSITRSI
jgi:hypothetical protein